MFRDEIGDEAKVASESPLLVNVHEKIFGEDDTAIVVQGSYEYYHYTTGKATLSPLL